MQITDGKAENPEVWDAFYEQAQNNKTCQLNIQETFSDGRSLARWLHYVGNIYWQDEYLVDYVIYFGNDPEYEPRTWYVEPGEWDLEEFIALTGYDYELWNMDMFYVYETDGHMKVGLRHDWSDIEKEYWLTEEDYGTNMMEPVIEFDR